MESTYYVQEAAIREVSRVYDILKQLQGLVQLKSINRDEPVGTHELAEPLFRDALQALNHALSILKSGVVSRVEIKPKIAVIESGSPVHSSHESVASYDSYPGIETARGKRKRVEENSWTSNTSMPYDDGFQWRKYGDKKISGTNFSRGYFRCTHKEEQGCQAKKLVQQTSDGDAPLFQVTYTNKHTCNTYKTRPTSSSQPTPFGSIQNDNFINKMPHNMPQLLDQGSFLGSENNLREMYPSPWMVERNCEWDIDSFSLNRKDIDSLWMDWVSDYCVLT